MRPKRLYPKSISLKISMWELINQNRQRSIFLFIAMGICLLFLGSVIGNVYAGEDGWAFGIVLALIIWVIMSFASFFAGDKLILSISNAQKVTPQIHPQLFNVVEEMKIAASLPAMPKVYIIPEKAPNAFATGRTPQNSAIVVTAGLLERLNRDELQGVIAHETAHIYNRDILYMTFSGVLLGSIVLLSHTFLRSLWFTGGRSRRSSSRSGGGGQAQLIFMAIAILFAILAPLLAQLLYLAISRKREYLADATAVRFTRYPEGLASALEKISQNSYELPNANKATAGLYIVNPLLKAGKRISNLSSTHPPIDERIKILRTINGGANYSNYQEAYNLINSKHHGAPVIPPSGLNDPHKIPLKEKSAQESKPTGEANNKGVDDLIKAIENYYFIPCSCGLQIKVPPDYANSTITCPKCERIWPVPAVLKNVFRGNLPEKKTALVQGKEAPLVYQRQGKGWESFQCSCGAVKQISPTFAKSSFECNHCGRKIVIKPSAE